MFHILPTQYFVHHHRFTATPTSIRGFTATSVRESSAMIVPRFSLIAFAFLFLAAFQLGAVEKRLPIKGEVFTIEDHTAFLILPDKPKSCQ